LKKSFRRYVIGKSSKSLNVSVPKILPWPIDRQRFWWVGVVVLFLAARLVLTGLGVLWMWNGEPGYDWIVNPAYEIRNFTDPDWGRWENLLVDPWYRWDTGSYLKIAASGYSPHDGSIIFPPLYPILTRAIAPLVGSHYLLAALLVSNISCLVGLLLLYRLGIHEFVGSHDKAAGAVQFLMSFPTAFYLYAAYTESLFLALALGAWLLAYRKRWILAGTLAGLASLARLQGWILAIPLIWIWLSDRASSDKEPPVQEVWRVIKNLFSSPGLRNSLARFLQGGWAVFFLPVLGVLGYMLWLRFSGLGTIEEAFRVHWGLEVVSPWKGFGQLIERLFHRDILLTDWIDLVLFVFFLVMSIRSTFKLKPEYSLYLWGVLGMMLMRGYSANLMAGFMRYLLTLFPIFLLLADSGKMRRLLDLLLVIFLGVQYFLLWVFLHWYWVA
jgi:hypothetical protein